jgi:protein ImuB
MNSPRSKVQGPALRRFRPPIHADVEMERGRPGFIGTLLVSNRIVNTRGPWRASGDWWDQRRWLRQEWDVETRDGAVYRLFCAGGSWFLEGVYD